MYVSDLALDSGPKANRQEQNAPLLGQQIPQQLQHL
jgi:hypothetical protein